MDLLNEADGKFGIPFRRFGTKGEELLGNLWLDLEKTMVGL